MSRSAVTYEAIKRSLLEGAFALGSRLAEERLARELGVSRTPVREALSRLHAEGLVDRHTEGGYTPAVPNLHEIVELYEVRAGLEQTALGRPDAERDHDALVSLRDDWATLADEPLPPADPAFVLVDEDFHVRLAASSGNAALVGILSSVNERIRAVRMHDFLSAARVEATIAQHLAIVEAVIDGDLGCAATTLGHHLEESASVVHTRAAEALARMIQGTRETR